MNATCKELEAVTDYLVRALAFEGTIRAYAVRSTEAVGEMQHRHAMWPTATAAVGRTMTATLMMGAMLKGEEKLTVKVQGGGPIGSIVCDANAKGQVRGYATNPQTHFDLNTQGKLDVRRAVGVDGMLAVVKDIGLRDYFTGQVPIISGEIAEDFTQYFVVSEQVPSAVGLGVLVNPDNSVKAAGGFIIQVMPGATNETITEVEKRISTVAPISSLIERGLTPEEILGEVLGTDNVEIIDNQPVAFSCECSKERFGKALISLGEQELSEMLEEDGQAEAECHFCSEKYLFLKEELEGFIHEIRSNV